MTDEERRAWSASGPVTWAAESYALVTGEPARYCRWTDGACRSSGPEVTLTADYQRRFEPVVERRLQQAGVRLAVLIEEALAKMGDEAAPAEP